MSRVLLASRHLLALGIDAIHQTLVNATAATQYTSFASDVLSTHFALQSLFLAISDSLAFGGNILCQEYGNTPLSQGFQQFTGRLVTCDQWCTTLLEPTRDNVFVATSAAGLVDPAADLTVVCLHDTAPSLCLEGYLGQSVAFVQSIHHLTQLQAMAAAAAVDVRRLAPSLPQYMRENATQPLEMVSFALLDLTYPTFDVWSWLSVLEWAVGDREVVRFQGDVGGISVMTEWTPPSTAPVHATDLPTTFTTYALGALKYITGVMLGISSLVVVSILACTGHIEPLNLLELNRVAGIVWVGRPLLLLRSVTALCLLSTSTLELDLAHSILSSFHVPGTKPCLARARPRGWFT
ncbi:Aste57867_21137 [Aphanomyces stellatus]|uniref:Aste57867_21137 protein n=1 Tax=Aphanomyces stellatus TaxID=120398 RepID=A0A485LLF0_9STRA|nr:hypothetical protein As57867_021069 [Aphanomyces stellatus]VFT97811.1 Aste57867_21137 [Aphanomyces stellatus]